MCVCYAWDVECGGVRGRMERLSKHLISSLLKSLNDFFIAT